MELLFLPSQDPESVCVSNTKSWTETHVYDIFFRDDQVSVSNVPINNKIRVWEATQTQICGIWVCFSEIIWGRWCRLHSYANNANESSADFLLCPPSSYNDICWKKWRGHVFLNHDVNIEWHKEKQTLSVKDTKTTSDMTWRVFHRMSPASQVKPSSP